MAMVILIEKMSEALDKEKCVTGVFFYVFLMHLILVDSKI